LEGAHSGQNLLLDTKASYGFSIQTVQQDIERFV
jgi:hypothetical protein